MKNIFISVLSVLIIASCASKTAKQSEISTSQDDITLFKLDTNKDGKIDCVWAQSTKDPQNPVTVWRKSDLNYDEKFDIEQHYADGKISHEKLDLDFDGVFDAYNYYENGVIVRSEYSMSFGGRINMWIFYKDGKPLKKEVDTNKTGKPDYFEFYKDSKIDRIGRDYDGDGIIDVWENL